MCLAIPAKILRIDGNSAEVDFGGVRREVKLDLVDAKEGDWVIVHTGYAIQIMSEEDAQETLRYFEEILKLEDDN